jgi:hypothetical protein
MTPKEKAQDLFNKVDKCVCGDINLQNTKDMAVMFCDEILDNVVYQFGEIEGTCYGIDDYWEEVKKEIGNLHT